MSPVQRERWVAEHWVQAPARLPLRWQAGFWASGHEGGPSARQAEQVLVAGSQ